EEDLAQVSSALAHEPAPGGPRTRVILVEAGELVVDESIPGIPTEPEEAGVVPVPDLVPLLEREPERIVYVVVETSRDGGEVRVLRAGPDELVAERAVEGRTDTLHPVKTGGWRQDRLQHHAEEIWRQTQGELAERIDDVVRRHRPRLLVVAGDIRARQLLEGELGPEPRAILAVEPTNTRADGADPTALEERIRTELQRILAEGERDVLDRVAEHDGRGDGWAETRVGAVVRALASAQVDTLVLDADALRDERLLALSAAPWIATARRTRSARRSSGGCRRTSRSPGPPCSPTHASSSPTRRARRTARTRSGCPAAAPSPPCCAGPRDPRSRAPGPSHDPRRRGPPRTDHPHHDAGGGTMTDAPRHEDLPLPEFDHIPLGTLPQRLHPLDERQVLLLVAYERAHGDRLPVMQVLERRLEALRDGAEPTGAIPAVMPEVAQGGHREQVTPATSGPPINPPSQGDPTNPAQPR
ncbi:Vms1/Ankzf1 family peptidyl-tRNA hydrolase, partial [Clavibacter zhangzhiyongii]|uniref:baeRF2 domain-containing protein n=1 Tax=Clavibacter zhangzhiyongii TaxID=2768071 RepID=UPI00195A840E